MAEIRITGGELRVGQVVPGEGDDGQVVDLRLLRTDVLDVAWRTGTSLTVLVRDVDPPLLPLIFSCSF